MKSFSNACGVKDSLELTIEGLEASGAQLRRFPQPFLVIGRDTCTDLRLDDPQVSRRHVYLQVVEGWAFWMDLESRTGARTEAGPRRSGWLAGGRILGLGPYVIRRAAGGLPSGDDPTRGGPPLETPLVAQSYGRKPVPDVVLEFLNGPSESTSWPMRRLISLIGSAKGCKFRLTDPSVAAFHASLVRTPAGLWIVDVRGDQSITVNAVPLRCGLLVDGDVLGIGRYRIRVRCGLRDQGSGEGAADPDPSALAGPLPRPGRAAAHPRSFSHRAALAITSQPAAGTRPAAAASLPGPSAAVGSGVEVVSSDGSALARPHSPESTEAVLVPLVNQFSLMQQQMFDQFQQAMGMLVQMFGTMHREQMEVIREELDRLRQLSQELQELKSELADPSRESAQPSGARAGAGAGLERRAAARSQLPAAPAAAVAVTVTSGPPARGPGTAPRGSSSAAAPPLLVAAGVAVAGPRQTLGTNPAPPPPDRSDGAHRAAGAGENPTGLLPTPEAPGPGPDPVNPGNPDHDAVLWIHQRIAALQDERETRWQKILKLIPGAS